MICVCCFVIPEGFEPEPGQMRIGAHADSNGFTILRTDGKPGLQVSTTYPYLTYESFSLPLCLGLRMTASFPGAGAGRKRRRDEDVGRRGATRELRGGHSGGQHREDDREVDGRLLQGGRAPRDGGPRGDA